jgi:superfamily II helicase
LDSCPDHEQKFFCVECATEDLKHVHKKVKIKDELDSKMKEWESLVGKYKGIKKITDDCYPQYENLIKYLDNEDFLKTDLTVKSPTHKIA